MLDEDPDPEASICGLESFLVVFLLHECGAALWEEAVHREEGRRRESLGLIVLGGAGEVEFQILGSRWEGCWWSVAGGLHDAAEENGDYLSGDSMTFQS